MKTKTTKQMGLILDAKTTNSTETLSTTTKVLINTLLYFPDFDLLSDLHTNILNNGTIIVPNLHKLFYMLSKQLLDPSKQIILKCLEVICDVNNHLMNTEIYINWKQLRLTLIPLIGAEDEYIRRKTKLVIMDFLARSRNNIMVLEQLYYVGLENYRLGIVLFTIPLCLQVLKEQSDILQSKTNIVIVKLVMYKVLRLTNASHSGINSKAKEFIDNLFYARIDQMDLVLQRLDKQYKTILEKLWQRKKYQLMYHHEEYLTDIQYSHLPIVNDLIFGVYEPFVLKNIFKPYTAAAHRFSIRQFTYQFIKHYYQLTRFINVISKIILRLLPYKNIDIINLLKHIISLPGICNIIAMFGIVSELINQLDEDNVVYRKEVRECLKMVNYVYREFILKQYEDYLASVDKLGKLGEGWIKVYEIFLLVYHWAETVDDSTMCFPPVLEGFVRIAVKNLGNPIGKIRNKCREYLLNLLDKYSGYKETVYLYLSTEALGQLYDELYQRKAKPGPSNYSAKNTFIQYYLYYRRNYLGTAKNPSKS